jgi:hypothetical protein
VAVAVDKCLFYTLWQPSTLNYLAWSFYCHPLESNVQIASTHQYCTDLPKLDLVLDLSIIACLLGLFNTERLAREMSAVTLVMDIL